MTNPNSLPRILGGYELVERVGGGGMGTVYRAIDRRSGTTVAVKIIHDHLQRDPNFVERFRDEAHLASLMTSPYIVRVIEFGSDQGQYFLVAEFVEGSKLSDLIEAKRLTTDESLAIASQVAMALQAAAAHRVVHRDVKPDNIIITPDNAVKLMDFGVARLSYVETRQLFLGTVAYAAPEQFRGQTTIRSDIYSLGVVLFQMLAGELPFKGDTLSSLIRMHEETAPPLEKLDRVPQELRDVVTKCLEKDPDKRYQDPSELLEALRRVRRGLTTADDSSWMAQTMMGLAGTIVDPAAATVATPLDGSVNLNAAEATPQAPRQAVREVYMPPPPVGGAGPAVGSGWRKRLPLMLAGVGVLGTAAIVALFVIAFSSDSKSSVLLPEPTQSSAVVVPASSTPLPAATSTPVPPPTEAPAAVATIPPTPLPLPTATQAPPIFVPPTAVLPPVAPPVVAPPPPAPPTSTPVPPPPPTGATYTFVGFSDHTGAGNFAPGDVVASGGSLRSCTPGSLYAFVNFTNLQQPKQFVGVWTLNGSQINQQTISETVTGASTFWQVQGTPLPLTAGTYRFQISVDGSVVSSGSFTLTC